ncbi:MAG: hypothetical protein M3R23_03510, partial [Actinomycetota bacterium]|nr:hypothetical protein [Actinomycetota bacterium]
LGLEPFAVVDHDYEFEGATKMRWLERNRWAFVLRVYPGALLALLAPARSTPPATRSTSPASHGPASMASH